MNKKLNCLFLAALITAFTSSLFAASRDELLPAGTEGFPLIKIISTENDGNNDFVTKPVAKHVRESQMSWGDYSNKNSPEPWYEKCTISLGDKLIGEGQVKVRGNWTTNYPKKSLRIKFDKKQNIAGLHGGEKFKNWVLLASFKDASILRDSVGLQAYRKMFPGYASDCCLVELEVNGEYFGVYLLAEQQEAKRVGLTEPEKDDKNTDIGYLIEFDSYYYTEDKNEQFEINYGGSLKDYDGKRLYNIQKGYTIKSDINDKAQHDFIADYMNKLWKICYEAVYNKKYYKFDSKYKLVKYSPAGKDDSAKCYDCVSKVINLESLADTYIFNELVCDPDIYLTSFFMNVDFGPDKDRLLYFNAPWDFDSTMGNKNFCAAESSSGNITGRNDMFAGRCQTDVNCSDQRVHANPWLVIFIKQAWFQKLIKERWAMVAADQVLSELQNYIDENSSEKYKAVFDANRQLWGDPSGDWELCEESQKAAAHSQAASAEYLRNWLTNRFAAVNTIIMELK